MAEASGIRVMVVDDYELMRTLLERCLVSLGFSNVRLEAGADEALAALRTERFDLIISDYRMAGIDGLEFLRRVRDDPSTRDIRFIMLTGSDDPELPGKAKALGVSEYITKPVEPRHLKETITRLFGAVDGHAAACADPRPPAGRDVGHYRPGDASVRLPLIPTVRDGRGLDVSARTSGA